MLVASRNPKKLAELRRVLDAAGLSGLTLVSLNAWIRAISLAAVGIGIIGKSPSITRAGACWRMTPSGRLPRRMAPELR